MYIAHQPSACLEQLRTRETDQEIYPTVYWIYQHELLCIMYIMTVDNNIKKPTHVRILGVKEEEGEKKI